MSNTEPAVRPLARRVVARFEVLATTLLLAFSVAASAQEISGSQRSLADHELWNLFAELSEPGGSFVSENLVSNEVTFQHVIPELQRSLTPGGVYIGVGPEQNFTYIANLRPRMAFIVDIRRQNAVQHFLYKALFELSPTRTEFVSRLFSRPITSGRSETTTVAELFDAVSRTQRNDSAFRANLAAVVANLTVTHRFPLSADDLRSLERVYGAFFSAGPEIHYGYRSAPGGMAGGGSSYASYATLQTAADSAGTRRSFLATEENYAVVRDMQLRNLIVPVVGDFAGPSALRAVGDYVRSQQTMVTAFYVSNVEQYLFQQAGAAARFYGSVQSLPLDTSATFIRSVTRVPAPTGSSGPAGPPRTLTPVFVMRLRAQLVDSSGVILTRITLDTTGSIPVTVPADSILRAANMRVDPAVGLRVVEALGATAASGTPGIRVLQPDSTMRFLRPDSTVLAAPTGATGAFGGLRSGLASIATTLHALATGALESYVDVVAMTRTTR